MPYIETTNDEQSEPIVETPIPTNPEVNNNQEDKPASAVELLFEQNRAIREERDQLKAREEAQARKMPRIEAFVGKISQAISGFFRAKGVNTEINSHTYLHQSVSDDKAYLESMPDYNHYTMSFYRAQMERNGYTEEEIEKRIASIESAKSLNDSK